MNNEVSNNNDGTDCYSKQVQYFFKHTVDLPDGSAEHNLAYVHWYKPVKMAKTQYYFSIKDEEETCNVELWKNDFFLDKRDCIIPVHNILCRFIPVKYKTSNRNHTIEYLAINPINRKYHIQ